MSIGDKNKIIEVQAPSRVSDGMGGFTKSYSKVFDGFASIWPISAKEQIQSDQMTVTMALTHRIGIWYRRVLKPEWRIKYGNRYFSIVSILNHNEENRELELLCKEVKA